MTIPEGLLDPQLWAGLTITSLYAVYDDGEICPSDSTIANQVYGPSSRIPLYVICRISTSTKRLEKGLAASPLQDIGCRGRIHEVTGGGSPIGVMVGLAPQEFKAAHFTPDGLHLCNGEADLPPDVIIKPLYDYKTFRSFRVGPADDDDAPHDLMMTAKARWFRERNDPKFLGFSKGSKK